MKVALIGAGNLATHLAEQLRAKGCDILQIYSRTEESASTLAKKVDAQPITDITSLTEEANFYIFSLKDSVVESVLASINHSNGIWIHTAGSLDISVFGDVNENHGVLYPLQTFSKYRSVKWREIPIFIEASNPKSYEEIEKIATLLSDKVYSLSSEKRKYLHVSAVFACNFTNHMYFLAKKMSDKTGLPFEILLPLIRETSDKVNQILPVDAQTGPAIRFDTNVIDKHLKLIDDPRVKELYQFITQSIHNEYK